VFQALAQALAAGLSLWEHKEKNKYNDKLIQLERDYYAEENKATSVRSDAVMDNLEFELRLLARAFAASARKQDPAN
jgi:hypothetical protein